MYIRYNKYMATKGEERFKIVIKEYMEEKHKDLAGNVLNIFIWGFGAGLVFAYTSLTPFLIGMIAGYTLAKRDLAIIDVYLVKFATFLKSFEVFSKL